MGYPMARNLAKAGHQVAVWSNTASKAKQLASEEEDAAACDTPAAGRRTAPTTSSLASGNTAMSEEVLTGENGVIDGAKPGTVVADASTISPTASREIGEKLGAKDIHFLDAPCTGSTPGAINAALTFMIGGDRRRLRKNEAILRSHGQAVLLLRRARAWACRPSSRRT